MERELVVAFVAGDRVAFNQVFQRLKQDLYFQVRRFFSSPFDQEEAFQEVWLQIHRMRGRFDVNRHQEFVAWARRVARNRCIDLLKARGRRPEVPVEQMEPPCAATQVKQLADARLRQALAAFVERLDPQQQQFFELCFNQELSHDEIAAAMSISARRSKYLKQKLIARLMKSAPLKRMMRQP